MADGVEILEIKDEDELYRRLAPDWVTNGEVNSAAFKEGGRPRSGTPVDLRISVDLARETTPQDSVARAERDGFGLGALTAAEPRSHDLTVVHKPIQGNYSHSSIDGDYTKAKCRALAEATNILIQPAKL